MISIDINEKGIQKTDVAFSNAYEGEIVVSIQDKIYKLDMINFLKAVS